MNKPKQMQEILARGGIENKDETREKTIRVRKWTYDQLREIGKMGMDFDDVITILLKDYKEHRKRT
ncbi:MAG TPA: hypothetical protein VIP53_09790 [Nitrososphaera sp.]